MLELIISAIASIALLSLSFVCRRKVVGIHLASLAVFFTGVPLLRALFGQTPTSSSSEIFLLTYLSAFLYGTSFTLITLLTGSPGLNKVKKILYSLNFNNKTIAITLAILITAWALRIFIAAKYGILFSGSGSEDAILSLPYWISIASPLVQLLVGGVVIIAAVATTRDYKKFAWAILFTEVSWAYVSSGRRSVIFLMLIIASILFLLRTIRFKGAIISAAAIFIIVTVSTPLFLTVRNINSDYLAAGFPATDAFKKAAFDGVKRCGIGLNCRELISENAIERGNALEFKKSIVAALSDGRSFLLGHGLINTIQWSIPSVLIDKPRLMTEQLIQEKLGLPFGDDAISIPAVAYADFGLAGVTIAGMAVALVSHILLAFALQQKSTILTLSITFGILKILFDIESDPLGFIALIRNAATLCLAYWLIDTLMSGLRAQKQRSKK